MKKLSIAVLTAALVLFNGGSRIMAEIESPEYSVMSSDGTIEIRSYEPVILAEVTISGERTEAANKAFSILFKYIQGENISNEKIAMTAPVNQQGEKIAMTAPVNQTLKNSSWIISFTMPAKYSMQTIPKPKDPRITVHMTPREKRIAIRFSGRWTDSNFEAQKVLLEKYISIHNLKKSGEAIYAYYNAPFSLPFLRRNEVMYVLDNEK